MTAKKLMERIRYWSQLLLLPVYWFSFLIPRDKSIWLFGSTFGRRFADNPRYLYLYVSQHRDEFGVRPVWISHNKEIVDFLKKNSYEAYYYHSLKGIWLALRAKVYLFDNYSKDINFWQSGGAVKVNLWHGIPLKKIQTDNIFDRVRHPKNIWEKWKSFPRRLSDEKPGHYVLTTSDFLKPIFSSAFKTDKVLTSGYPRNDRLVSNEIKNLLTDEEKKCVRQIEDFWERVEKNGSSGKVIYYMPTFRDSEMKFFDTINLIEFQEFLKQNNMLFCVKLHPKSKLKKEFDAISDENILVIAAETDPHVFLELADVLVTDYSSIYFDFLLRDRPIVFFDYDLKEYLKESREMYFEYEKFTPGEKAETMRTLEDALLRACNSTTDYQKKYMELRREIAEKVFDDRSGMASSRLLDDIRQILEM